MVCIEPIALLKRSDAEVVCFYSGADWQLAADRLSQGHCFEVIVVLVAPRAVAGALERISEALKQSSIASGWFACNTSVAIDAISKVAHEAPCDAPRYLLATKVVAESALECHSPTSATGSNQSAKESSLECSDDASWAADSALWTLVERCNSASASKAVDVRAALRASFGKHKADLLLANTKASVARSSDGHAFRMLRLGGHALRLKVD